VFIEKVKLMKTIAKRTVHLFSDQKVRVSAFDKTAERGGVVFCKNAPKKFLVMSSQYLNGF
jgi:hypothetical protein